MPGLSSIARPNGTPAAAGWRALVASVLSLCALACGSPEPRDRSVVLVVVDALRADHLSLHGYERRTSPELERLATTGLVFEHAYATSPWTLPTFGSLLTGLYPSAHGAGIGVSETAEDEGAKTTGSGRFLTLRTGVPTVAEALAASGYLTGAIVSNPFLDPGFGLDRGFAHYDNFPTDNASHRPADRAVDEALEWVEAAGNTPFFLLLHLFEPHLEYDAPEPFRGRFTASVEFDGEYPVSGLWDIRSRVPDMSGAERSFIRAAYDEEIAFVDQQIGRLADELAQRGVLDRGLLVVTADHGEELFEHEGFEHGHALWDEVLRVPLLLFGAGVPSGRRSEAVSSVDVAPTLLAFAGVDFADGLPGVDLLSEAPTSTTNRPLVAERTLPASERTALLRWPFKVIIDREGVRLFNLARDPGESFNLADGDSERAQEMVEELAQMISTMGGGAGLAEAELDERLIRRLRALGYLR